MRKRFMPLLLVFIALFSMLDGACAQEAAITLAPRAIRPGKLERISFSVPEAGEARLSLNSIQGEEICVIREGIAAAEGTNHLAWDGMDPSGEAVPAGEYLLCLTVGGQTVTRDIAIGEPSPVILALDAMDALTLGREWAANVTVNLPGTLTFRVKAKDQQEWTMVFSREISQGENSIVWDGSAEEGELPAGEYSAQFVLTDDTGFSGTARQMKLTLKAETEKDEAEANAAPADAASQKVITPGTPVSDSERNYWTMPVGVLDEQAIWEIMMQPMVVIDGNQKEVYRLRRTPDNASSADNIVGEITYASQGLHILETRDDGWTLVEAYNSSYGPDCASRRGYGVTDDLIRGYVKTSLLKTVTPRTEYGLLIDKLNQTMYIFSEGKCIGTLLVSTGLNNAKQSWNETPSGEFVMISKMGGFAAGNLWCAYGMRVNGGCAVHEVPYIGDKDTPAERRDYSSTVKLLGQKASHGCIRVQKAANEQGQNIKWLWENLKVNSKVLIWDDTGRMRPYPVADDYELYYNPDGGKYYHENQYCPSVRDRFLPLTPFTYGELDTGDFASLKPCTRCTNLMRKRTIDEMNRELMSGK